MAYIFWPGSEIQIELYLEQLFWVGQVVGGGEKAAQAKFGLRHSPTLLPCPSNPHPFKSLFWPTIFPHNYIFSLSPHLSKAISHHCNVFHLLPSTSNLPLMPSADPPLSQQKLNILSILYKFIEIDFEYLDAYLPFLIAPTLVRLSVSSAYFRISILSASLRPHKASRRHCGC